MKAPNFFIIGAPKCGTSALHHYVSEHPQVFLPHVKEPHYYCTDVKGYPRIGSTRQYRALFAGATDKHVAVGEASVYYLYSKAAVPNILRAHPDAKFIVMVRDPVELVHSLHSQYIYGFLESEKSFEIAWSLQGERAKGNHIPPFCECPEILQYAKVAMVGEQIERLLSIVPREAILFIDFDDFKKSTRDVYSRFLQFLGIEDDGRTEFPPVNANRRHSYPMLTQFLMYPPFPLNKIKKAVKRMFGLYDTKAMAWCYNQLLESVPREKMRDGLRQEIAATFVEDQIKLKQLLVPSRSLRAA